MTEPHPTTDTQPGDPYILWLPGAIRNGAIKSALIGADRPQTVDLAYPYLTRFINPDSAYANRRRDTMFAHAPVIARTGIRNTPGATLGAVASRIGRRGISPESAAAMAHTVYKSPLRVATRTIESILRVATNMNLGVDYQALYDTYYWWDVNPLSSRSARRQFLNNFYIPPTPKPSPTEMETI